MNKDELNGKGDQVKGKAKQAWGDLTDNEQLHTRASPTRPPERSRRDSARRGGRSETPSTTSRIRSRNRQSSGLAPDGAACGEAGARLSLNPSVRKRARLQQTPASVIFERFWTALGHPI